VVKRYNIEIYTNYKVFYGGIFHIASATVGQSRGQSVKRLRVKKLGRFRGKTRLLKFPANSVTRKSLDIVIIELDICF